MSVFWPSPLSVSTPGPHSSDLYPAALPANTSANRVSDQRDTGAKAYHGTVSENGTALSGTKQGGVNWTFYDRILVLPSFIELGNLISAQTRTVSIWNGFLTGKPLTDFDVINAGGIIVTEPVTPPYTIRPLEMLNYELSIGTEGPAVINADFIWRIAGVDYASHVVGQRAVLFPYAPNFREDFSEQLEWKSDIMRSYDGSEQRRALRTKARRSFDFKFSLFKADAQSFQNLMFGWQNRVFAVPVWSDRQTLATAQNAGDTVLSANPTNYSFIPGGLAILYKGPTEYEVINVGLVNPTTITASNGLENAWPAGTAIYPVVLGHLPATIPTNRVTDSVIEGIASFSTSPDVTDPYTPDAVATSIYDGKEVITVQPNWASPLDLSYDFAFSTLDQATGPIEWMTTELVARNTRKYTWMFSDRATILAFRKFLNRQRGRVKTCWVPSWTDDFTLTQNISPGDSSIAVKENGFRTLVGVNTARDRIAFRLNNGAVYYRRITGVSLDVGGEDARLILDSPIGVAVTPSQVKAINMLNLCRFAADSVTIAWKSDSIATVDTALTTVPA